MEEINYWTWWFHFSVDEYKCKIIWHYPTTNTVLRYIKNNWLVYSDFDFYNNIFVSMDIYWEIINTSDYILDITKEIKDYTDKQKQELYDFLKTL
jgi:hypothetical protein